MRITEGKEIRNTKVVKSERPIIHPAPQKNRSFEIYDAQDDVYICTEHIKELMHHIKRNKK